MLKAPRRTEDIQEQAIFPFGPGIFVTSANNKIVNLLKEAGEAARSLGDEKNVHHKLVATMKHEYELAFCQEDSQFFMDFLVGKVKEYYKKTSINNCSNIISAQFRPPWINYTYAGDFNPMHIHTAELSYIIYVDIPDNIREEYKGSHNQIRGIIEFMYNNSQIQMAPKTGDMFIFPSEVYHSVYPFEGEGCRISVAGNIHDIVRDDI